MGLGWPGIRDEHFEFCDQRFLIILDKFSRILEIFFGKYHREKY